MMIVASSLVLLVAACVAFVRWRRDPSGPAAWSLVTFAILGSVFLEVALTDLLGVELGDAASRILIAVLVLFPYSLFRFARSFEGRVTRWDHGALVVSLLLVAGALFLPDLDGDDDSGAARVYLFALLVQ